MVPNFYSLCKASFAFLSFTLYASSFLDLPQAFPFHATLYVIHAVLIGDPNSFWDFSFSAASEDDVDCQRKFICCWAGELNSKKYKVLAFNMI